jgi:hypothetical protein
LQDLLDNAVVEWFLLENGDTMVLEGAAGQVCAHQVFAFPGVLCVRIRTFWVL